MQNWIGMAGGELDRAAGLRREAQALAADKTARGLAFWRGRVLVSGEGRGRRVERLPLDHPVFSLVSPPVNRVFLGRFRGVSLFACDLSDWEPEQGTEDLTPWDDVAVPGVALDAHFVDFRTVFSCVGPGEGEAMATGRSLFEWHRLHQFCAQCGEKTVIGDAGWRRDCPSCARQHFPRVDPVVIMLVLRGNSVLMGRSPGWPEGMISLLAGFVEPGETLEAAVRREVFEEAGIRIGAVRLLTSQPWPDPSSLMIGAVAQAESEEIVLDPKELDHAEWLRREEVLAMFAGQHPRFRKPRTGTIAGAMARLWLADWLE
ncbi:MAG: NAD(+) diphosphatase [Rhodobacterales bacterium]|nr:MAG: NAD(+) diphosphatase [Rhodobacterales bacterium]